ncbi:hypothetical protein BpHYR1_015062 [Brachionus plicatilis]|uniref:Uncharacterized protein n=1 Tax=Brachionus plicatilis TaxID=10195 RepID=A0A3M7SMV0_BRAPC|nr:hypothetical protein BpHYR1_015062 [Brachionus plicatilis]
MICFREIKKTTSEIRFDFDHTQAPIFTHLPIHRQKIEKLLCTFKIYFKKFKWLWHFLMYLMNSLWRRTSVLSNFISSRNLSNRSDAKTNLQKLTQIKSTTTTKRKSIKCYGYKQNVFEFVRIEQGSERKKSNID